MNMDNNKPSLDSLSAMVTKEDSHTQAKEDKAIPAKERNETRVKGDNGIQTKEGNETGVKGDNDIQAKERNETRVKGDNDIQTKERNAIQVKEDNGIQVIEGNETRVKEDSGIQANEDNGIQVKNNTSNGIQAKEDNDIQVKEVNAIQAKEVNDIQAKERNETRIKEDNGIQTKEGNETGAKEVNAIQVKEVNDIQVKEGNGRQAKEDNVNSNQTKVDDTQANEDNNTQLKINMKSQELQTPMPADEKPDNVNIGDDLVATTVTDDKVNFNDDLINPVRPLKNTIVLAFSFLTVYSGFQGIQNIQSSINQADGLGVASLFCIYATLIVAGMLSPVYLYFVGLKKTLILAFASHCIYTASNFYPTWWSLIPSSILLGLTVAPMWLARHLYINGMGQYDSQANKADLHSSLSKYNGIFYSFFDSAMVGGNLISSVVLHQSKMDQSNLNGTKFCGADDCPGNRNQTTEIVRPDSNVIDLLLGIYLACGVLGLATTVIFLRPVKLQGGDRKYLFMKLTSCCTIFKEKKLLLLMPLTLSQAVNTSILLTSFTKSFVSCTVGVKMVGFVMMTYGIFTALSAFTFGHVAKYSGRKPLLILTLTVDIVTLVSLLLWKPVPEQVYVLFLIPIVWAIGTGIWSCQIMALVAIAFPNKQPSVFANINTMSSLGFTFVLGTDRLLCLRTKFYIAIVLWTLGLVGYTLLEIILIREKRQHYLDDDMELDSRDIHSIKNK